MKLHIQSIHFDADAKLLEFTQRKMDKLETFTDELLDANVYFRLDKDASKENKIVEIKVNGTNNELFSKERSGSFEAALDEATEALRRQILKKKQKKIASHRG